MLTLAFSLILDVNLTSSVNFSANFNSVNLKVKQVTKCV